MKILCVGDLHLSHTRLELCSSVLNWIASTIEEHKPDAVVYLGDEFDTHAVLRAECISIWTDHLKSTLHFCPVYWILGNHCMYKPNDSTFNALIPFTGWRHKHLNIITSSVELDGFGFVPYLTHNCKWEDEVNNWQSNLIFTHNTFIGADYGHTVATDGFTPLENSKTTIISGHIHKPQQLSFHRGDIRVVYPGTPYSWSGSDADQVKGLSIFDTDTELFQFIESPFPAWKRVYLDLSESSEIKIPDHVRHEDHLLISLKGLRSDVKAWLVSDAFSEIKKYFKSASVSTTFLDSAKSSNSITSIKSRSVTETIDAYMTSIYKGSAPVEEVKEAIILAIEGRI
jgi:DNA repair exonuclease SbcCD nuclease subunit